MEVYVFSYHVKPTKGSPEYGKVGGAYADIWVYDSSQESAKIKALSHLIDFAWEVIESKDELVIHEEQIALYRADAQASYYRAKKNGLDAFFSAYPMKDRSDGVVEIRQVDPPANRSGSIH